MYLRKPSINHGTFQSDLIENQVAYQGSFSSFPQPPVDAYRQSDFPILETILFNFLGRVFYL
jgi:hypothetical protein